MKSNCIGCRDDVLLPFEFKMAFQPIVDVANHRVWGYEALVRGANGESAFSILDQLTDEIRYQFDQSARVMAIKTAGALFERKDLRLSINFMPKAVYEPAACIQTSLAAAKAVDFPQKNLMFEFTEDERMDDPTHVQNIIEVYRKLGFWTALDDFGAGYAGLGLLSRLQPDLIKIDMELLRDIHLSHAKQVIVAGVVGIARALNIVVLGEGVEREEELAVLRAAGISLFQGDYFAKAETDGATGGADARAAYCNRRLGRDLKACAVFEAACEKLGLVIRHDPTTALVADIAPHRGDGDRAFSIAIARRKRTMPQHRQCIRAGVNHDSIIGPIFGSEKNLVSELRPSDRSPIELKIHDVSNFDRTPDFSWWKIRL